MATEYTKSTGERFCMIPDRVLFNKNLGGVEHQVYCYTYRKAYFAEGPTVKISNRELSKALSVTDGTITRAITKLEKEQIISSTVKHTNYNDVFSTMRTIKFLVEPNK